MIELTLSELMQLHEEDCQSIDQFYGEVILRFLRREKGELERLSRESSRFSDHAEYSFLVSAIELRLQIRRRQINPDTLQKGESLAHEESRWQPELMLLVAQAHALLEDHTRARKWYLRSVEPLEKAGCRGKAERARVSAFVARSRNLLDPLRKSAG